MQTEKQIKQLLKTTKVLKEEYKHQWLKEKDPKQSFILCIIYTSFTADIYTLEWVLGVSK